ncbi:MAG: hypothetical protein U0229_14935 [Anaeromyxobacter sp.]
MKTLLAAALLALPLAALAGDEKPATASEKPAQAAPAKPAEGAAAPAKAAGARPGEKKDPNIHRPEHAKPADKGDKAPPPAKKDEKPCEPVKPCSID